MRTLSERNPSRTEVASDCSSKFKGLTKFFGVILFLVLLQIPLHGTQTITLSWSPSIDVNVVGYRMYYGMTSHGYTNMVDVGKVTNATISGLVEGSTYFFAATTYNSLGLESSFSNEASYTVPRVPVRLRIRTAPARQVVLTVTSHAAGTYNIQASPNLTAWTVIGVVTLPAAGSFDFTDTNAANFPKRFYRTQ